MKALTKIGGLTAARVAVAVALMGSVACSGKTLKSLFDSKGNVVSISVSPGVTSKAKGTNLQFTATAIYQDSSKEDVTGSATWSSSDATIVSIGSVTGFASANAVGGPVTIRVMFNGVTGTADFTVTAATLVSLGVTPASPTISAGSTRQFTATGTYTDGTTQNLSNSVTWSSSNTGIGTIDISGLATASATPGSTNIQATCSSAACAGWVSGTISSPSVTLTVTTATLVSIAVTPSNPSKAAGTTQQFTAIGTYSDSSTQDLTSVVTWSSGTPAAATINSTTGLGAAVAVGSSTITATCSNAVCPNDVGSGNKSGSTTFNVTTATLVSIAVTPANPSKAKGLTQQFTATGTYTDSSTQNITTSVAWSSGTPGVATISNGAGSEGLASTLSVGTSTITATLGAVSGNTTLTVSAATLVSIAVTPATPSKAKGTTQQFTATGTYTDSSTQDLTTTVSWSSTNTTTSTISNAGGSQGLASALVVGTTTISATCSNAVCPNDAGSGSKTGSTTFTVTAATLVSIAVTPSNTTKAAGTTQQFTATGSYTDSTTQDLTTVVTWSSATPAAATISNGGGSQGLSNAVAVGSSTISATCSNAVCPNDAGSGNKSGSTTFTVTAATLVSIAVTPNNPSKAAGTTQQFTATGTYTDNTTQDLTTVVTWSSGTTAAATISNAGGSQGLGSAVAVGSSTITATCSNAVCPNDAGSGNKSGSTTFTVTAATLVSIAVTPSNPSKAAGTTQQFTATGTYTNGNTQDLTTVVTWSSGTTAAATISNAGGSQGLSNAVAVGTSTISATCSNAVCPNDAGSGNKSGSTTFTVTAATLVSIAVTPTNPSLPTNRTMQFTATGTYTDSTTQDLTSTVTWASSDTSKADISNAAGSKGIATSTTAGTTTISATSGSVSGSTTLTVTNATLVSITITPVNPTAALGYTQQFTATGLYSDSTTQNLTSTVTWQTCTTATGGCTSGASVATISNAGGSQGIATPAGIGLTYVRATSGAITGNTSLTVTNATLVGITISPTGATIPNGTTKQYSAIGTFSDSTTLDLTTQVTWETCTSASSYPTCTAQTSVAAISNAAGSRGLATAAGTGTTKIGAKHVAGSVSNSTALTVSTATLSSITVTPSGAIAIGFGTFQQFTATGLYSDGSSLDISTLVTWGSSLTGIATISNVSGTQGRATSVSAGTTIITASCPSGACGNSSGSTINNTASLEVRIITLVSINVTPANPSVQRNSTQQMIATGTYNDGTQQDLTLQVTWSTSDAAVAVVSNAAGSLGAATAVGTNGQTATITATRGGVSGNTTLTVISDTVAPTLTSAALNSATQVRVLFSESVNVAAASNKNNYKIVLSPGSGSCAGGDNFSGSAQTSDFTISSVSVVSPSEYLINIGAGLQGSTYMVIVDKGNIQDIAGNTMACSNSANFAGLDTVAPTILSAVSFSGTVVRVTFSENVNATEAQTAANYKIVTATSGACSDGTNFSGSTQTSDFSISSVTGSGAVYDITLSATQAAAKAYTVLVNKANIHDLATPTTNAMGCPNNADFTGLEQLKLSSASCVDTTHVIATFSKNILTGLNAAGSGECTTTTECAKRYQFSGATSLGTINDARTLNGTVCGGAAADSSKICITHQTAQGGGQYTLTTANNTDGDGFNDTSWGSIRNTANTENVQPSPNDRRTFTGCAVAPTNFSDGPIAQDPFNDGSSFGYLASYNSKIYIGPNSAGNAANRFNPDGSTPESLTFTFNKDTANGTGGSTSSNPATSRDGGTAVPPYVTIGHTGCTATGATAAANLATGCGPDANDGRGLFASGTVGGTSYLFITGARSGGRNDHLYYTADTDTQLDFNYIDLRSTYISVDAPVVNYKGTESIAVFNSKVFMMSPGDGTLRPYMLKINTIKAEPTAGTDTLYLNMRNMDGFGYTASTRPNKADRVGATLYGFNSLLYAANSGSITDTASCNINTLYGAGVCEQTGGLIRSVSNDPGACTSAANGTCANWADITPSATAYKQYFSVVLPKLADLIPADRPIPGFTDFNGNLYMIRNACRTSRWGRTCLQGASQCTADDAVCPAGEETPQLWKCAPTGGSAPKYCQAGDWSLVAEDASTGKTNFGSTNNTKVSMLATNGSQLYIGFDNTSGAQVWRTKTSVTNPSAAGDFEQIGGNGFGDTTNIQQIFSAVSLPQSGTNYLYVSAGKGSVPVRVYRQQNN